MDHIKENVRPGIGCFNNVTSAMLKAFQLSRVPKPDGWDASVRGVVREEAKLKGAKFAIDCWNYMCRTENVKASGLMYTITKTITKTIAPFTFTK